MHMLLLMVSQSSIQTCMCYQVCWSCTSINKACVSQSVCVCTWQLMCILGRTYLHQADSLGHIMTLHNRRQPHASQGLRQTDHGFQLSRGGCDAVPANALVAHGLVGIHQVLARLICQLWLASCTSKSYEVPQLLQRNHSLHRTAAQLLSNSHSGPFCCHSVQAVSVWRAGI